ncbi:cytochrome c [Shewanella sp. H8]|uniref:cytochrome c n=1 Tax=Shewanella sp. H8 TaxID=3342676 RepID=UPI0033163BDC
MKLSLFSLLSLAIAMGSYSSTSMAQDLQQDLIKKGEYLSNAGDCVACHTSENGEKFAGGRAVDSPFGPIYSTNITPSKTAGIGNYTYEEFEQSLRHGIRADGAFLYPAMPYPSYQKITDEDTKAMYAYFMHGVKAVDVEAIETSLSFPFNQRWGIRFWDWVATDDGAFVADPKQSEEHNRGAYLVQGLGHCGSCHTPRGIIYQEKSYDHANKSFLSGADIGIWHAPSLRAGNNTNLEHWSVQDLMDYFSTGRNYYSAVAGEMTDVIQYSLSHLTKDDLHAMAIYLKSQSGQKSAKSEDTSAPGNTTKLLNSAKVDINSGARLYLDNCNACHFTDGAGAPHVFPQLDDNSLVNAENPDGLIHIILAGARLPSTTNAPEAIEMPGFGWRLNDKEVATLATFVRQSWRNNATKVDADEVKEIRQTISSEVLNKSAPQVY